MIWNVYDASGSKRRGLVKMVDGQMVPASRVRALLEAIWFRIRHPFYVWRLWGRTRRLRGGYERVDRETI